MCVGCLGVALAAVIGPQVASAQMPSNFEALELARSSECVPTLARLEELDGRLEPFAERSRRLLSIAEAIALEDAAIVDSLMASDSVEAAVREWFAADAELARRNVDAPSPELEEERAAAREQIKTVVSTALTEVQAEANTVIGSAGDLGDQASRCDGAIFIRSAVVEACASATSPVCQPARDSTVQDPTFRFVDSAESLWGLQELRAWTAPGPVTIDPSGQVGGGRTIGATRTGNVVVTSTFIALLRQRSVLAPEDAERLVALTDSLGFGGEHPDLIFVPSLGIRASLPEPLDRESEYVFHFGPAEEADVVWAAPAGSGGLVEGMIPLSPGHLTRLQAGDPITLTAIREAEDGEVESLYSIELSSIGQASAVRALSGYMAQQLPQDLARMMPPGNS